MARDLYKRFLEVTDACVSGAPMAEEKSIVLTPQFCEKVFDGVLGLFDAYSKQGLYEDGGGQGYFIVMNPFKPCLERYRQLASDALFRHFQASILYQRAVGDPEQFRYEFDLFAATKLFAVWKYNMSLEAIFESAPWLVTAGMVRWPGTAIAVGNLQVGFSGVQDVYDGPICRTFIDHARAIGVQQLKGLVDPNDHDTWFYGQKKALPK